MRKISYLHWVIRFMIAGVFVISCNREPASSESRAATTAEVAKTPIERGQELFQSYCVLCHGENADGNGPMAEVLKAQPSNLRTIQSRRDGTFPEEELYKIIDGREPVPGHGSGDMPVWGKTFINSENLNTEQEMQADIKALVEYLKTIQQ
jgi:mono/diheme cytochrome c family protein